MSPYPPHLVEAAVSSLQEAGLPAARLADIAGVDYDTLRRFRRGTKPCPHAMGLWLSQLAAWMAANPPPPVERLPEQCR